MTTLPPGGEYQQAPGVEIGWWLWLGTHWEQITGKRIDREHVYYTTHRVYRVGYLEAVLCRRTPPDCQAGPETKTIGTREESWLTNCRTGGHHQTPYARAATSTRSAPAASSAQAAGR